MSEFLLTTQVGSLPKPDYLLRARSRLARGEISREQLKELELRATREWVQFQNEIGIDVVVDGEQYRGDMVAFFAEEIAGFTRGGLVRSYGNRYYRKPIITGPVRRTHPITVEWWEYARSLTDRPVKGMLTGPYTIRDWSFDEHYPSRRDAVLALAEAIRDEAVALQEAGARYIQIDEPAVSTRMDELDLAIEALGVVTEPLTVHTVTHICYGDFHNAYPRMLDLPVDQIDLEMTNSDFDLLERFAEHDFTKTLGLGVVDVHSHRIESVDEVVKGIERTLEVVPPERVYVDPDCGLKTRRYEEVRPALANLVEAAKRVRADLTS
jgi:5-methyltetrahydropteroyltriglutamate--homocysteine methyltransferase